MTESLRKHALQTALQEIFESFAQDVERNVKRRMDQTSRAGAGEVVGASTRAAIARLAELLGEER